MGEQMMEQKKYSDYLQILKEELVPAMGCTEPIAIAYAAAKAREVLGKMPEKVIATCSGNIIKNAMCVTVPNTGDLFVNSTEASRTYSSTIKRDNNKVTIILKAN